MLQGWGHYGSHLTEHHNFIQKLWGDSIMHARFLTKKSPHKKNHPVGFLNFDVWRFMFLNWDVKYFIVSHKQSTWFHAKDFFVEGLVNGLSSSAYFQPSVKDCASDSVKNAKWIRPKILISGKSLHFRGNNITQGNGKHSSVSWKVCWK